VLLTIFAISYNANGTIIIGDDFHRLSVTLDSPEFVVETVKFPLQEHKHTIRIRQKESSVNYKQQATLPSHPLLRNVIRRTKRELVYSCSIASHYIPITVGGCARAVNVKVCMGSCPKKQNEKYCYCRQSQFREMPIRFDCPGVNTTISMLSAEHCTCCFKEGIV